MSRRASRRGRSIPVEDEAAVRGNVIVDPVGGFGVRPDAVAVDRHRARRRQLAALPPNEAEQRRAGLAAAQRDDERAHVGRSEEHTSELQSLMRISYAVFCLKNKKSTDIY